MSGRIPPEIIDMVKARADIVDLIQTYIPLKKAGRDFKACCPFHQEKTPSFVVNPERQHYHCFGCGKHGGAVTFVMERENVDFPTAIRLLAGRYNIFIPEETEERRHYSSRRQTPAGENAPERKNGSFKDRLFLLNETMREWFVRNLKTQPDSAVAQYLKTRNLAPESVERFSLGASCDSWDAGMRYALSRGFSEEELETAGLLKVSEDRRKKYDMFRNRLMFPIWDELGRVVGFSARTIESDPKMMKYVNTPETPVFRKGRILYGMNLARSEMSSHRLGYAILCEGQLDVIAMHAAGFPNSVAAEGTAFTPEQARMLRRYTSSVRLGLDSDRAGTLAVCKDAKILLPLGFDLKVIRYPGGKDPDELLKNSGREAIAEAVDKACDFFEFLLRSEMTENGDSPAGKARSAEHVLSFVALLESESAMSAYCAWVAQNLALNGDALYGQMLRIRAAQQAENDKYAEYERIRQEKAEAETKKNEPPPVPQDPQFRKALFELLQCILSSEPAARQAAAELKKEELGESLLASAVECVIESVMLDEWSEALERVCKGVGEDPSLDRDVSEFLMSEIVPQKDAAVKNTMTACLQVIRLHSLEKEYALLMHRLSELPPEDPDRMKLLQELNDLNRVRCGIRMKKA